jgi:nucleotidyltransferase/DNA polymerase involved in DNA repair
MFMGTAKTLCPDLVVLSYDFEQYQQVSEEIYKIFFR